MTLKQLNLVFKFNVEGILKLSFAKLQLQLQVGRLVLFPISPATQPPAQPPRKSSFEPLLLPQLQPQLQTQAQTQPQPQLQPQPQPQPQPKPQPKLNLSLAQLQPHLVYIKNFL